MRLVQDQDWLEWRRDGIGASDVAAIVGLSPWASPVSVYLEKVEGHSIEQTEPMTWGLLLEGVILDEWVRRSDGLTAPERFRQARASRPDTPHHRATLDGIAFDGSTPVGIVEVKNVGPWSDWSAGVPDYYQIQAQWQIHVTDLERGWLVALHTGNRLESYPIERDQKTIDLLVERVDRFWLEHVVAERMPPADGSEATLGALRAAYPEARPGKAREVEADVLEALRRRSEAKEAIKALEETVREADAVVWAALGDAEEGQIDGRTIVTLKIVEIPAQTRDAYTYRRLYVKKKEIQG